MVLKLSCLHVLFIEPDLTSNDSEILTQFTG